MSKWTVFCLYLLKGALVSPVIPSYSQEQLRSTEVIQELYSDYSYST